VVLIVYTPDIRIPSPDMKAEVQVKNGTAVEKIESERETREEGRQPRTTREMFITFRERTIKPGK